MHTRVGLTDGRIIVSDDYPASFIQGHIDENDGQIGSLDYADVRVEDVEDAIAFIEQMWAKMIADPDATFTVMYGGEEVAFPGNEVAWFRVVRDHA